MSPGGRVPAVDVARGVACVAMIGVHYERALCNGLGPRLGIAALEWGNGRVGAWFLVLAGVGVGLAVSAGAPGTRARLVRRALVLAACGYGLLTVWEGDLLHFLGLFLLFAAAFARASTLVLASVCGVLFYATSRFDEVGLDRGEGWILDHLFYEDLWTREGHVRHLLFNGPYPLYPCLAFVLFGIWLGRRPAGFARALPWALAVFLLAEGGGRAGWWSTQPLDVAPGYVVANAALATVVLSLCARAVARFPAHGLARLGRASLTVYVVHVALGIGLFDTFFQLACLSFAQVLAWWGLSVWVALAIARPWVGRFGRGPLESAVRVLSGTSGGLTRRASTPDEAAG